MLKAVPIQPDGFEWPAPWEPIPPGEACLEYAEELHREVSPVHPLYRVACAAVGRNRKDPNEFLLLTAHARMPLAFVHLTWKKEEGDTFPWVEGYESWEVFRVAWSEVNHNG